RDFERAAHAGRRGPGGEPRGAALRPVRRAERRGRDQRGGRRDRRRGLGRNAGPYVPALGGAAWLQGRAPGVDSGRRGRFPERDALGGRSVRLRISEDRAWHAPARAYLAV